MAAPAVSPPSYEDTQKVPGGPPPGPPAAGPFIPQQQFYPQAAPGAVQYQQYPPQGAALPPYGVPFQQPQIQYVVAPGMPTVPTLVPAPKASFPGPHTFLVYTLIVCIVCIILHPPSFIFAVPAFVLAGMSAHKKNCRQYPAAARLGKCALALTTITFIFTAMMWLLYTGLIAGFESTRCRYLTYNLYNDGDGFRCSPYY